MYTCYAGKSNATFFLSRLGYFGSSIFSSSFFLIECIGMLSLSWEIVWLYFDWKFPLLLRFSWLAPLLEIFLQIHNWIWASNYISQMWPRPFSICQGKCFIFFYIQTMIHNHWGLAKFCTFDSILNRLEMRVDLAC